MAVGVYVRVSTEEQRERQSIVTQRDFGQKFCDLHSLAIYEIYADDGLSGSIPIKKRPGASRLLEDARSGKFDQILVFKLDRIGRDTSLILDVVPELRTRGIRVRSMTEEFDSGTSSGYLMLTMLSGFATHEREVIRERSVAGTNRQAEAGAWMGGVVPYGYRKEGEGVRRRIVVNEEPICGFPLTEADIVRTIYQMSGTEMQSCQKIADHLNRLGVPCGSSANSVSESGKRNRRTAAVWRPSHIRNMIVSRTYMGVHVFGKRARNRNRQMIVRAVPGIVSEQVWHSAQEVLAKNRIMCRRTGTTPYLLKGLIKCGVCGLTFSGLRMKPPQRDHYYRCNGRQQSRGLHGLNGKKCPSKSLNGDYVERLVWADIEAFLRNPGAILARLRERVAIKDGDRLLKERELGGLREQLATKTVERDRVLALFRRGRIDETTLDQQLDQINAEGANLATEIDAATRALCSADRTAQLESAESLLMTLRSRLDGPIPPELKRRIVEVLVVSVEAKTTERWGVLQGEVVITYRFSQPDEPAPLVLPKSHRLRNRSQPPEELNTVGDHLLRRRLLLKLLQRQVAEQLGVDKTSVTNWERGRTTPGPAHMPAIIRFLGYNPIQPATGLAQRLVQGRTVLGLTQKQAASRLRVDQGTLARWERGEREPLGTFAVRARGFIAEAEASHSLRAVPTA